MRRVLARLVLDREAIQGAAQRWKRRILLFALALLVGLPAAWPILTTPFVESDDGRIHVNRQVGFDSLLRQGVVFPRLYPDLAAGYGYPLGTFYPPLSLYIAELPLLAGGDAAAGVRFSLGLALTVAAAGAFLLGRTVTGRRAGGWLLAAAYVYAPYLLANVYVRGAMAEAWALALLPWCFWTLNRWRGGVHGEHGLALAAATLALAGLLLAHNLIALIAWPIALLWWVVQTRPRVQVSPAEGAPGLTTRLHSLRWGLLPFGLAAAVVAFYWLPALAEVGTASLGRFADAPRARLLPLERLVDFAPAYAYSGFRLGLAQLVGMVAGAASALALRRLRVPTLVGAAGAVTMALLASELAASLWGAVRPLDPIQFPFRLFGPAALLGAIAIAPLAVVRGGALTAGVASLLLASAALAGLPIVASALNPALLTTAGVARWEYVDRSVGTTISQEYFPAGVAAVWRWPADGFLSATPVTDPPLTEARLLRFGPYGIDLAVRADQPTKIRLHAFSLPGWTATVDGAPVPTGETGPLRLLTVEAPAGEHTVAIRYGETPIRVAGATLSAVALLSLVAFAISPVRRRGRLALGSTALALGAISMVALNGPGRADSALAPADLGALRLLGGTIQETSPDEYLATLYWLMGNNANDLPVGVRLVAGNETVAESVGRPLWGTASTSWWTTNEVVRDQRTLRVSPGAPPGEARIEAVVHERTAAVGSVQLAGSPAASPLPTGLGRHDGLRLLAGHVTPEHTLAPGVTLDVVLDWAADGQPSDDYALFATLIAPDGSVIARSASDLRSGLGPTSLWQRGDRQTTRHHLRVPADAPPGRYLIQAGVAPFRTASPPAAVLGIALLPPLKLPEPPNAEEPEVRLALPFGEAIELAGYSFRDEGDTLVLSWQARQDVRRDYTVFVHLLDSAGRLIGQRDAPPQNGGFPTSLWSSGERVTDRIVLPEAAGARTILIGLYDPASGVRLPTPNGDALAIPIPPGQ
ncbi:MAG: hypothetical protein KatS3mg060_0449 [Dehalococcoidia bacterium]|nr:MAG: hypothetical protein KatS3mg060_0449 [Dehalococcoidia bacterium]